MSWAGYISRPSKTYMIVEDVSEERHALYERDGYERVVAAVATAQDAIRFCRAELGQAPLRYANMTPAYLLKVWAEDFIKIKDGSRAYVVAKHAHDYGVGDILFLAEIVALEANASGRFTGEQEVVRVSDVLVGPTFGLRAGYSIIAFTPAHFDTKLGWV